MSALKYSTKYYYSVGSSAAGWSPEFEFVTPPDPKLEKDPSFAVSIFGDWGYEDSDKRPLWVPSHIGGLVKKWSAGITRDRLEVLKDTGMFDFVWHLGDIAYSDDAFAHNPVGFEYEDTYNSWMNWIQNITATMAYMVSPGNHESECHSPACLVSSSTAQALSNFSAYNNRWAMPAFESNARAEQSMWYSWDYGAVHFVSVNTETDWVGAEEEHTGDSHDPHLKAGGFGQKDEYTNWLTADLAAADAARKATGYPRWIVAGGHRPQDDIIGIHTDLFQKYKVDLYVSGIERTL